MGGHGRTIKGREGATPDGTTRNPLGLGDEKELEEGSFSPGPVGLKAKVGTTGKNYFIEHLPDILTAKGFALGASFMEAWVDGAEFQKDKTTGTIQRSRALDHDNLKGWTHVSKHPLTKLTNDRPWLGKRKDDFAANVKKRWATTVAANPSATSFTFPDAKVSSPPALTKKTNAGIPYNDPTANDSAWADEVDFWGLWHQDSASDGAGIWEILTSSFDDYSFALGRFDWYFLPKGAAAFVAAAGNAPARLTITINELGIYAKDSYDFNGSQKLGQWNVESQDITLVRLFPAPWNITTDIPDDALYTGKMGWRFVSNGSFRNYRDKSKRGRDFLPYTDVKFTALNGGSLTVDYP